MNDEPTVRGGKVAVPTYLEYEVAVLLRDYVKTHKPITASDLLTQMVCALYGLQTKYEIEIGNLRSAANSVVENGVLEEKKIAEKHHQAAVTKVASLREEAEKRKAEEEAAASKLADEEKKYQDKIWKSLRKEIIINYDIISIQLKEISVRKLRGDEGEYEAEAYLEIRAFLESRKILHTQRDLSYSTFLECFNSINYLEEVVKPRELAQKDMAEEDMNGN